MFSQTNYMKQDSTKNRSSHQRCSVRKGVLSNFTKFRGKHLCQSPFFNKVAGLKLTLVSRSKNVSSMLCLIIKILTEKNLDITHFLLR